MAIDLCARSMIGRARSEDGGVVVALVYCVSEGGIGGTVVSEGSCGRERFMRTRVTCVNTPNDASKTGRVATAVFDLPSTIHMPLNQIVSYAENFFKTGRSAS